MIEALEGCQGTINIRGRNITNLQFANEINGVAGSKNELVNLVKYLDETSSKYGMEISAKKTKLTTNSTDPTQTKITVIGQKLKQVTHIKYLGTIISEQGSKTEVLARAVQIAIALAKLRPIWMDKKHQSQDQDQNPPCTGAIHFPLCMQILDSNSRRKKEDRSSGNETPQETPWNFVQRPHYKQGGQEENQPAQWSA